MNLPEENRSKAGDKHPRRTPQKSTDREQSQATSEEFEEEDMGVAPKE